jgi:Rad3-related DNA helicase
MQGWQLTRGHPGYVAEESLTKRYPLCSNPIETNKHIRICKWERHERTSKLYDIIIKTKPIVPIQQAICNATTAALNSENVIIPEQYHQIGLQQQKIGWE